MENSTIYLIIFLFILVVVGITLGIVLTEDSDDNNSKNILWVAVGTADPSDNGNILYSTDKGKTWTSAQQDEDNPFGTGEGKGVAYDGKGRWVAVGNADPVDNGNILYSTDNGETWTSAQQNGGSPFGTGEGYGVAYDGKGRWVAVGNAEPSDIGNILYSTDNGETWTSAQQNGNNPFGTGNGNGVAYDGKGRWVAVGYDDSSDTGNILYSTDNGETWTSAQQNGGSPFGIGYGFGVAYDGKGRWVAVGSDDSSDTGNILYSTDNGETWTSAQQNGNNPFGTGNGNGVAYDGKGTWVAVGSDDSSDTGNILYSTDKGETWTSAQQDGNNPFGNTGYGFGVAYDGKGRWVAVGYDDSSDTGNILYSTDKGETWTSAQQDGNNPFGNTGYGYGNGVASNSLLPH